MNKEKFRIGRITYGREAFLAVVNGRLVPSLGETHVRIAMWPTVIALVFLPVWLFITGIV